MTIQEFVEKNGSNIREIQLKKLNGDKIDLFNELQQAFLNKKDFIAICVRHSNDYIADLIKENNPFRDGEVLNNSFIFIPKDYDETEIVIYTFRPSVLIGRKGRNIKYLAKRINAALNKNIIVKIKHISELKNENKSE